MRRWRCPAVLRVKSAVFAGIGVAVVLTFFPPWFAVPVAVVLAACGLGMAVRAASVVLDPGVGVLVLRAGFITRRIKLTDITGVLVDKTKVSVASSGGVTISVYAWRKSLLDGWLRVPAVASDIGHAISSAVAVAQDGQPREPDSASARSRSSLAIALLAGAGLVALASAFLVRLSWHNPVMTAGGVLLALVLGISGLFYLLLALWLILQRRSARTAG